MSTASSLYRTAFLESFRCLGDACEDTCCKGWGMQVDAATFERYSRSAPELVNAVTCGEAALVMKRDSDTDYCVKFNKGWCGIHKQYGSDLLGDACHFFPRITRSLGDTTLQTASLSCPEIVRLILHTDHAFHYETVPMERLPTTLKDYIPEGLSATTALTLHSLFITAAEDATVTVERIVCRIHSVIRSLEFMPVTQWPDAAAFYLKSADGRLSAPQINPADDFNLLHALIGLISAAPKAGRPRLQQIVDTIKIALALTLPNDAAQPFTVTHDSLERHQQMIALWDEYAHVLQPSLHRWLQAQLSVAFFPFSGFGDTLPHRIAIIGVRLATLKLALMSELFMMHFVSEESFTRITQSLARFMDHLADPTLSLSIYHETEWLQPARLRGLLRDH